MIHHTKLIQLYFIFIYDMFKIHFKIIIVLLCYLDIKKIDLNYLKDGWYCHISYETKG